MTSPVEPDELSYEVRTLLRERVHSIDELELLLLLSSQPDRRWSLDELCARFGVVSSLLENALAKLCTHHLAQEHSELCWSFQCASPELRASVQQLADRYEKDRVAVLVEISQHAVARVRRGALSLFAETLF